jgi:phage pi2 protein 07
VRNQGYTRAAVSHVEKHNERKNENYSNLEVVLAQSHNNIHFKACDGTYLGVFDKMVKDGEISTRGLKLNDTGTKPESSIVAEMIFDVNTEFFEEYYASHGYSSGYDFAKAFYAEAYKMAVNEVGDEKYILSAVLHADERNKGLSEKLGRDVYHYHLHVTYIPVVQKEIKWTKRAKPELVGKVKEVITQVNHSKKWESEKVTGEDGKEHLIYSYSKLQDRYHDHMKAAGFHGFERGREGSTAQHLSMLEYKAKVRQEELAEKENLLELANMELDEAQTDLENARTKNNDIMAEQEGLQSERDKLENQVAPIRELQKLKTKTQNIKIPDKPVLGNNAKMPYDDLVKLKEMADVYIANEAEIKDIRKRRVAVSKRETDAATKEKNLTTREKSVRIKEDTLASANAVKSERDNLITQVETLTNKNDLLVKKSNRAFDLISQIVKAARLLKHGTVENGFGEYRIENLTAVQGTLIDALAYFGARLADNYNLKDQADHMKKFIGLDEGIKSEMKILNPDIFPDERPQQKSKSSRGWDR